MEAVPRLHMLWFALKSSPEGTSFSALKKVKGRECERGSEIIKRASKTKRRQLGETELSVKLGKCVAYWIHIGIEIPILTMPFAPLHFPFSPTFKPPLSGG